MLTFQFRILFPRFQMQYHKSQGGDAAHMSPVGGPWDKGPFHSCSATQETLSSSATVSVC